MFTFTGVCYCRLTWQPSNNHSAFPCIIKIFDPAHEALCHVIILSLYLSRLSSQET